MKFIYSIINFVGNLNDALPLGGRLAVNAGQFNALEYVDLRN
jgi:hypothetical protein